MPLLFINGNKKSELLFVFKSQEEEVTPQPVSKATHPD